MKKIINKIIIALFVLIFFIGAVHITQTAIFLSNSNQESTPWQFALITPGIFYYIPLAILLISYIMLIIINNVKQSYRLNSIVICIILFLFVLGISFIIINLQNRFKTYIYNDFGPKGCVLISDNPITYTTRKFNSDKIFIEMMETKGYKYLVGERMGSALYFVDNKGNWQRVGCHSVEYYMVWTFQEL